MIGFAFNHLKDLALRFLGCSIAGSRKLLFFFNRSKVEPQYMQRKRWEKMIDSIADTPWLNGKMRVARSFTRAPEFRSGVPLQSGQIVPRRFKNVMNQTIPHSTIPPMIDRVSFGVCKAIEMTMTEMVAATVRSQKMKSIAQI
ncbi:MAG: hypothetical protein EAZ42_03325 [Verrucomicrobia bacterium]|nr:MAG: hypothetical protein EAZ42_03325 [Verrucomicrobiota bacterium]